MLSKEEAKKCKLVFKRKLQHKPDFSISYQYMMRSISIEEELAGFREALLELCIVSTIRLQHNRFVWNWW
jgi:hypothetical protein